MGARCRGEIDHEHPAESRGWGGCARRWAAPAYVYRIWSAGGVDLYVGVADDWMRRLKQHKATKPWWPDAQEVSITEHCCRWHALECEAFTICELRPRYNISYPRHSFPWYAVSDLSNPFLGDAQNEVA